MEETDTKRFWAKVEKGRKCWLWTASLTKSGGYGQFSMNGRPHRAHRLSWVLAHGPIPKDLCVLHTCDTPSCVKPSHLFLGTRTDNSADKMRKGRHRSAPSPGEAHGMAKLTEADVLEMRCLAATGRFRRKTLGVVFGVTPENVTHIVTRATWKHI